MSKEKIDLKQKAYEYIRENIIKCEWMPEEDISEDRIVQEIGVSRTPVREALLRLQNEKLVNIYPRKGIIVSSISVSTINSIFQVREMVEPKVLCEVMGRLSLDWLTEMKNRFSQYPDGNNALWYHINIDREFHSQIIKASNNIYLVQLMENIFAQDERIRILSWKFVKKADITNHEHLEIINAVCEKDRDRAEECMRNHILNAKAAALNLEHRIK